MPEVISDPVTGKIVRGEVGKGHNILEWISGTNLNLKNASHPCFWVDMASRAGEQMGVSQTSFFDGPFAHLFNPT